MSQNEARDNFYKKTVEIWTTYYLDEKIKKNPSLYTVRIAKGIQGDFQTFVINYNDIKQHIENNTPLIYDMLQTPKTWKSIINTEWHSISKNKPLTENDVKTSAKNIFFLNNNTRTNKESFLSLIKQKISIKLSNYIKKKFPKHKLNEALSSHLNTETNATNTAQVNTAQVNTAQVNTAQVNTKANNIKKTRIKDIEETKEQKEEETKNSSSSSLHDSVKRQTKKLKLNTFKEKLKSGEEEFKVYIQNLKPMNKAEKDNGIMFKKDDDRIKIFNNAFNIIFNLDLDYANIVTIIQDNEKPMFKDTISGMLSHLNVRYGLIYSNEERNKLGKQFTKRFNSLIKIYGLAIPETTSQRDTKKVDGRGSDRRVKPLHPKKNPLHLKAKAKAKSQNQEISNFIKEMNFRLKSSKIHTVNKDNGSIVINKVK
jgi:hypothetical protein